MLPIPISELWDSYRTTTLAADASERDLELAWSGFHGGIFALARVLAHMDQNGEGDDALAAVRWPTRNCLGCMPIQTQYARNLRGVNRAQAPGGRQSSEAIFHVARITANCP